MSVHEQFAEDLALYALGCLQGDEKVSLEKHLAECISCRNELEHIRGDAALLALSTTGPAPPARAKNRLMEKIAQEPGVRPARSRTPWWAALGWVTAAALIFIVAMLWSQNMSLRTNAIRLSANSEQLRSQLEQARRIAETLTSSDALRITVLPVNYKTPPPEGKAIYSRQRGGLIFMASNLQPLSAQKAYELWLIPAHGVPIPAGTFKPDAKGTAIVINPPLPPGVEAKAFAITIEPEQGSTTPTMPIVMMGGA
jgi:anti-sigma-K factor RskA